ncbi:MAG: leucine-rich repeat protein [Prevotellaceae bacterium]|nr:leucine-rich repeat protein [Prevotellaceae bacterium]
MLKKITQAVAGATNCSAVEQRPFQKRGVSENPIVKSRGNLFGLLLVLALIGLSVGAANAQTWNCGYCEGFGCTPTSDVTATLNGTVLTISGTGDMKNYTFNSPSDKAPWEGNAGITDVIINSGVTSIGKAAFAGLTNLTSIAIPSTVIKIGEVWADNTTQYGMGAFAYCSSLQSITLPDSLMSIGSETFAGCSNLSSIVIPNNVLKMGRATFSDCINLSSVTLGNNITKIGSLTFYQCSSLTNIIIPNSVDSIGDLAFQKSGLASISIPPNVSWMGAGVFRSCLNLTSVSITELQKLPNLTFYQCSNLASAVIGADSIDMMVFYNCSNLTSLTLLEGNKFIGNMSFTGCNLSSVEIPNSTTMIDYGAFANNNNLKKVTLGTSLDTIGQLAFNKDMDTLISYAVIPPKLGSSFTTNTFNLAKLFVPCHSVSSYQTQNIWSNFVNYETLPVYDTINAAICYGETYTLNGFNENATGIYTRTEQTANGCDSIITLNLTVRPQINTEVTVAETTLSASQTGAAYQWLDCNNGNAPIPDATAQTFTPSASGNYAVEITLNGCTGVSECHAVTVLGIEDIQTDALVIYPNPAKDHIVIEGLTNTPQQSSVIAGLTRNLLNTVQIYDISGRAVETRYATSLQNDTATINVSHLPAGVYFLRIGDRAAKFVKE